MVAIERQLNGLRLLWALNTDRIQSALAILVVLVAMALLGFEIANGQFDLGAIETIEAAAPGAA